MNKVILVTGGAGYIGSHVCRQLLKEGYEVVIVDNFTTGQRRNVSEEAIVIEGDYGDASLLGSIFSDHQIHAVIHMAASIEVGESVEKPLEYLDNNTLKTEILLKAMTQAGVKNILFSSTAAVYGLQEAMPIAEQAEVGPLDPYGYSKLISEHLIRYYAKFVGLNGIIFRYFNACGSDFDGAIKDSHSSHLITFLMEVAQGKRDKLTIFGDDYNTPDGTGVRDYIHVLDIARAHVAGLAYLETRPGIELFNIGTSEGTSVKQIVQAAEALLGQKIPVVTGPRRPGDAPITVADNAKIKRELGFELQYSDIKTILETSK